jgi:hypothetical protein
MADFRMLEKLQEIRRVVFDVQWHGDVLPPHHAEKMHRLYDLVNEAIDLDHKMTREHYVLDVRPAEADAGSWEEYQHIKAQKLL